MEERVRYLTERLEAVSKYYFKGMGGKLTLLRHSLEGLQEGDSCGEFDLRAHANEAYLWVAEKYSGIGERELAENPETICLQDVPRHIAELGQNIQSIRDGDTSSENISSAHLMAGMILEKGQEFRKIIDTYTKELIKLGYRELAWDYKHKTTHNFAQIQE